MNSFKMIGYNFPAVLKFDRLFLKLNRFICNQLSVLPDRRIGVLQISRFFMNCCVLLCCLCVYLVGM